MQNKIIKTENPLKTSVGVGKRVDVMPVAEGPILALLTKESHEIFKYESNRLQTFSSWPPTAPIKADRLARAGFYYSGDKTSVTCFECGGRINSWSLNDVAIAKHRHYFPNCKFVIGNSDDIPLVVSKQPNNQSLNRRLLLSSSDPSPSSSPLDANSNESSLSTSPSMMNSHSNEQLIESGLEFEALHRNNRNTSNRSDINMSDFYQLMKSERNRLRTYYIRDNSKWNLPFIKPEDMAKAGFYFLNDDRVECAFCTGVIENWSEGDRPLEEHAKHFPCCPFIMEEDVGNIPIGSDPIRSPLPVLGHDVCGNRDPFEETANRMINTNERRDLPTIDMEGMGIHQYSGPSNQDMGPLEARKRSFDDKGWDQSLPVSADKLSEAGFYYIGYRDHVKCFHCSGGLCDWEEGDDPWIEHAKKFPTCHFLKLNKSESFIKECQRLDQNGIQSNDNDINSSDDITVCQIVDQWMNSDLVRQLISINQFSTDLIRATLNRRYLSFRKPFESFAHLYETIRQSDNSNDIRITINQLPSSQSQTEENVRTNRMASSSTSHSSSKISEITNEIISKPKEENESQLLCKICFTKEIGVVFLPCGHQMVCKECAQRLTNCPVCRQPIRGYVRTYFS